jgi:Ca2+-binding EF-hand superfamily protein
VFFCLCGVLLYNVQLLAVARDIDHWNEYMEMEANKRKERLENEKDPLEEAFEKIDLDGSGTLDREEVRQVLEMISGGGGEPVSEMELNEAMAELDGDSSGEVRLKAHVAK